MTEPSQQTNTENRWYLLEEQQAFSQSSLWDLQRRYFAQRGVDAWRQGEVPHYITSNPTLANSYAEIVFTFLCEQQQIDPGDEDDPEPLYICELGAGSGRFAFHFLRRLTRLCELAKLRPDSFRYVLTDFTQTNLDSWLLHPCFRTFFSTGVLDIALFDISRSEQLTLQLAGRTITAGSLHRPIAVVANYVFDSIPQELYYIANQRCHQCLVTLIVDEDPDNLNPVELLARLRYHYDYVALSQTPYQEPNLQELLAGYQHALNDKYILFPAVGLRGMQRLRALSKRGVLLLSADKGHHRLDAIQVESPPHLVFHGSISLCVNYHAFKVLCEQSGGIALFPGSHHSLNISCLLMLRDVTAYKETQRAYQRHVQDFSPDDFYTITRHAAQYSNQMSVAEILAYLRLSYYDGFQLARFLPRLMELAAGFHDEERQAVIEVIDKVWESYFPLGEDLDLAYQIACLLYEMNDYRQARAYFERSIEIYGQHTGTLFNLAACQQMAGQSQDAESLLRKVLKYDPGNQQARELLADCSTPG